MRGSFQKYVLYLDCSYMNLKHVLMAQNSKHCTNTNFLFLILYYDTVRCNQRVKLGEGYMDLLVLFLDLSINL